LFDLYVKINLKNMKKILFTVLLACCLLSTSFAPVHASGSQSFTVENKDGVMFVTTNADGSQTLASSTSADRAGSAAPAATIDPGTGYAQNIGTVINFALRFVMVAAVLLVFFFLILAGIEWITSGGEKGKTEAARNKITAAIIGLVILAASYAILLLLIRYLGFSDLPSVINNVGTINSPGSVNNLSTPSPEATTSSPLYNLTH
jgi:hypothetical protein